MLQRWSPSEGERAKTAGGQQTGDFSDGIGGFERASERIRKTGTAAVEEQRFEGRRHREDEAWQEPDSNRVIGTSRELLGLRNPPEQKGAATHPERSKTR